LRWPAPDRFTAAVPPGATVRGVPTLILSGDRDTSVPTSNTKALRKVFPDAWFLPVAGAGHPAAAESDCARSVIADFVRAAHRTGATCSTPVSVPPAVPEFPLTADKAIPATALPGDGSSRLDHRIATVTVRTVLDAWLRSFRGADQGQGMGVGLRGGTFGFSFVAAPDRGFVQPNGARFARDVSVSGNGEWVYATNESRFEVAVTGPSGQSGMLTATGLFGFNRPYGAFTVTGSLGGHPVKVRVPAN
jgi:hypothetical protein